MPAQIDLKGLRFGKLVVIDFFEKRKNQYYWNCICDCGKATHKSSGGLRSGSSTSCGCMKSELAQKQMTTHGLSHTPEFKIYTKIKDRTLNPNCKHYSSYGGRGVGISLEWENDFGRFYTDMGGRPTPKHTIERRDNDKGYSKENCYWATMKQQCNNRRSNVLITVGNITKTTTQWCEEKNLPYKSIIARIERGWDGERALTTPLRKCTI